MNNNNSIAMKSLYISNVIFHNNVFSIFESELQKRIVLMVFMGNCIIPPPLPLENMFLLFVITNHANPCFEIALMMLFWCSVIKVLPSVPGHPYSGKYIHVKIKFSGLCKFVCIKNCELLEL